MRSSIKEPRHAQKDAAFPIRNVFLAHQRQSLPHLLINLCNPKNHCVFCEVACWTIAKRVSVSVWGRSLPVLFSLWKLLEMITPCRLDWRQQWKKIIACRSFTLTARSCTCMYISVRCARDSVINSDSCTTGILPNGENRLWRSTALVIAEATASIILVSSQNGSWEALKQAILGARSEKFKTLHWTSSVFETAGGQTRQTLLFCAVKYVDSGILRFSVQRYVWRKPLKEHLSSSMHSFSLMHLCKKGAHLRDMAVFEVVRCGASYGKKTSIVQRNKHWSNKHLADSFQN